MGYRVELRAVREGGIDASKSHDFRTKVYQNIYKKIPKVKYMYCRNPCERPVQSRRPRCNAVTSRNGDGAPLSKLERGGGGDGDGDGEESW